MTNGVRGAGARRPTQIYCPRPPRAKPAGSPKASSAFYARAWTDVEPGEVEALLRVERSA